MKNISNEARDIIFFIVKKMSSMKYSYRNIFESAYESAIKNYGFKEVKEGMNFCVDEAIKILNQSTREIR